MSSETKMATVEISDGFHGSSPIMVRIPLRVWAMQQGNLSKLSDGQRKRVEVHFCPFRASGCTCGVADRADWQITNTSLVPR
ncbi:MAG: hypothetical protein M3Y08_18795 [Fibrobacterota bacterium]|nr:hypothetical protein [Fibrobacterota bacterium]